MTRKALYSHLNEGKTILSKTTRIYYKLIKGVLHKKATYNSSTQAREWNPSELKFKTAESLRSLEVVET